MEAPRGKRGGQSKGQDSRGYSIRANRRSESTSKRVGSEVTSKVSTLIWPWAGVLKGSLGYFLYLSYVKPDQVFDMGRYEHEFLGRSKVRPRESGTSTWESSMLPNWKLDWVINFENTKGFNKKFKWGQGVSEGKNLSIPDLGLNRSSIRFSVLAVFRGSVTGRATGEPCYNQCKPL